MKIKRAFCFFEQSGVFRDAFRRHGIPAECYDIDNQCGQTDHITDLFQEVDSAFNDRLSIINDITPDDITLAFFPCIHFEQFACMYYQLTANTMQGWSERRKAEYAADKFDQCAVFFRHLRKLIAVFKQRRLRLVIENPVNGYTLLNYLLPRPQYVDYNRTLMGDCFVKPTAYWFINCEPEQCSVVSINHNVRRIKKVRDKKYTPGVCSLERSRISPEYAYNFIAAKLLGNSADYIPNLQKTIEL